MARCKADERRLEIINQDPFPIALIVDGKDKQRQVYELPGARLDSETGIYVPATSVLCTPPVDAPLVIAYTHGNRCIHHTFPTSQWGGQVNKEGAAPGDAGEANKGAFRYTVPAWNSGDPGEVCRVSGSGNRNARDAQPDEEDDDDAPGASNGQWWGWFWRRQGMRRTNTLHMVAMAAVVALILAALAYRVVKK